MNIRKKLNSFLIMGVVSMAVITGCGKEIEEMDQGETATMENVTEEVSEIAAEASTVEETVIETELLSEAEEETKSILAEESEIITEIEEVESETETEEITEEEKGFFDFLDPTYSETTSISYSSGDESDWSYGNQRKEFPSDEVCYVRVGSTTITDKGKGVDNEITVTYRFTGAENCKIELSDGIATEIETDDSNIVEYQKTLSAKKKKKAEEKVTIFRYEPQKVGSITLEVIYDNQIDSQYDERSTIYFVEEEVDVEE